MGRSSPGGAICVSLPRGPNPCTESCACATEREHQDARSLGMLSAVQEASQDFAASCITSITRPGWESIGTWLLVLRLTRTRVRSFAQSPGELPLTTLTSRYARLSTLSGRRQAAGARENTRFQVKRTTADRVSAGQTDLRCVDMRWWRVGLYAGHCADSALTRKNAAPGHLQAARRPRKPIVRTLSAFERSRQLSSEQAPRTIREAPISDDRQRVAEPAFVDSGGLRDRRRLVIFATTARPSLGEMTRCPHLRGSRTQPPSPTASTSFLGRIYRCCGSRRRFVSLAEWPMSAVSSRTRTA